MQVKAPEAEKISSNGKGEVWGRKREHLGTGRGVDSAGRHSRFVSGRWEKPGMVGG